MKNLIEMSYAVNEAIKNQESVLIQASENNAEKLFKNARARIRVAKSFASLSESVIDLIATYAIKNEIDLESLCDYSNYKTANRIAQRAMYLADDSALDVRTSANIKLFDNSIKSLDKSYQAFSFDAIAAKTNITSSMLKNILKSAQFFNLIERTDKRSIKEMIKSDTLYSIVSAN